MRSTPFRLSAAVLFAVAPLAGCGGNEEGTPVGPPADDIPSQEELDAQAAEEITEENADEAFDDLQKEIEEDE